MDKKTLKNLEFYKILNLLSENINTDLGKNLAKKLRVRTDIDSVRKLQEETSEAQKLVYEGTDISVYGIVDLSEELKRARIGSSLDNLSLLSVANNLKASRTILNKLSNRDDLPILKELSSNLFTYEEFERRIFDIIISEYEIADNASLELQKIRREIKIINERIRTKLNQIISASSASKYLQDLIVTQRQDRYVIPVKAEYRSQIKGIVHDTSSSGATIFIEPMSIVEMNNNLRLFTQKEKDEINRILLELSNIVGGIEENIKSNQDILAEIDFIMGKGKFSVKTKSLSPKLSDEKTIRLVNAKHPLLDKNKVVPLNVEIGKDFTTLVITGPNTGGKTVTLKTIGLFILMNQAGLHIPCDFGSELSIFDKVFSDIGDDQSISQNLSTFSSHMTNIVRIMKSVNNNSLVLFDELGSGTDPDEGSALAISILESLKSNEIVTVATTHYSNLKNYALNTEGVENASVEFDVDTLSPTYRLLVGIPGKSNAFFISKKLGLSNDIISKAKSLIGKDNMKIEDMLLKIEKNKKKIQEEKDYILKASEEIKIKLSNIERRENNLENKTKKTLDEAKRKAQDIIAEAKQETANIIKELRNIKISKDSNKEIEMLRQELGNLDKKNTVNENLIRENSKEQLNIEDVNQGEIVFVPSFSREATIVSIDKRKKVLVLQMDNLKINLPIKAVERAKEKIVPKNINSGSGAIYSKKSMNISQSCDIRGLDLEMALDKVSKYIDDAYLSNLQKVTVIHGIGNRVLKNGINDYLKNLKYVKTFREGDNKEGGVGVTVINFTEN